MVRVGGRIQPVYVDHPPLFIFQTGAIITLHEFDIRYLKLGTDMFSVICRMSVSAESILRTYTSNGFLQHCPVDKKPAKVLKNTCDVELERCVIYESEVQMIHNSDHDISVSKSP